MNREVDALVAKEVFGCQVEYWEDDGTPYCGCKDKEHKWYDPRGCACRLKYYSTEIEAAWEVVEKLRCEEMELRITYINQWACSFSHGRVSPVYSVEADTGPMAICLAALKAVGHDFNKSETSSS